MAQNYMEPAHIFGRSKLIKAFDAKRIDDILGKAATPAAEPPVAKPEAPKPEPPVAKPEPTKSDQKPKSKRGRKAGPKAETIETPPVDDAGINNEDGTDENGADE